MIKGFFVMVFIIVVAIAVMVFYLGFGGQKTPKTASVEIRGQKFDVEVADTPLKQEKGLSGRTSLEPDEGMLFLFTSQKFRTFWMKDTLIPLDIIWIRDNKIIGFDKDVPPEPGVSTRNLKKYHSPRPAGKVLEFNAGTVDKFRFEVGDEVIINL